MALLTILGFISTVPFIVDYYKRGEKDMQDIILELLDLITITVPPALPTCL